MRNFSAAVSGFVLLWWLWWWWWGGIGITIGGERQHGCSDNNVENIYITHAQVLSQFVCGGESSVVVVTIIDLLVRDGVLFFA